MRYCQSDRSKRTGAASQWRRLCIRATLTHITFGQQLGALFSSHRDTSPAQAVGQALAAGWTRYFGWEIVITAGCALLLAGALAGWARLPARQTIVLMAACLAVAGLVNVGGIMVTAFTAPARLRQAGSVEALVGRAQLPPVRSAAGPLRPAVQAVVMGDSTASGLGYQLLRQLAELAFHPTVLINLYYDPFDPQQHCLDGAGLTPAKESSLTVLLTALNEVLARGARASGLITVHPDFSGHALCDPDPYVQGLGDPAPFHPTPAGELAIALADLAALKSG